MNPKKKGQVIGLFYATKSTNNGGEMKKVNKFHLEIRRQGGQGIMEYIILSSFIGLFCLVAMKQFGSVLEKRIEYLKAQLVEHMKVN